MSDLLPWLPAHSDPAAALRAARQLDDPAERLAAAVVLAGHRRDFLLTDRIARLAGAGLDAIAAGAAPGALAPLRVALLGSHTLEHLVPAIRVAGLARGLALAVHVGAYGQYRQALLGADPALDTFAPQLVVLALDAHDAPLQLALDADEATVDAAVAARVDGLRALWRQARERHAAQVVQQTLMPAGPPLFGSWEMLVPASPHAVVDRLNAALRRAAREDGVLLLDLALHAAELRAAGGLADPVRWHQAKQLVDHALAPLYGDLLARVAMAAAGRARKCLVLDLDNTLWGGVAGDDGVEALLLGQGSASGEAFLAFQRHVALLARRGIVLAVCSKNDPEVAEAAFAHPEMGLAREDIAAFVANWDDKAGNLRRIARQLELGLDSLVFVDDNPAERAIVRRELPEVAVPELPEDVAHWPAALAASGWFEAAGFTTDDAARARSYAGNAERHAALEQATDLAGYLRSLEMTLQPVPVRGADLPRVVQLVNKTNQFNLTTRRHTRPEVERLLADPGAIALALRLRDRFGDNGVISVVLARRDAALPPDELLVDTWLMSCRVLGRQVEEAVLEVLVREARAGGARALIGEYRPTARNGMVAGHYPRLGFVPMPAPPGADPAARFWRHELAAPRAAAHHIEVAYA
ncbi:HAD-IIIC family phosphatase [Coralloluteibacterium stylophorae]|uniref:HAD family hydrolase n=1 Tax=Coralloluteibacterium stylophorae TaxID=1776034 RepID=A0A8J7VWW2_9GAMM|nr:HAD-IIIC family phosphatase [Coralloluteibacterium stylophorae]MBS7457370.1 HAD family hydrolase [Coralloluteibacterium stylophorae]